MALGRASLLALFEVVAATLRFTVLWIAKAAGSIARRTSQGQVPLIGQLVIVALLLLVLPPFINGVLDLLAGLDVWGSLGVESDPSVGQWWTAERVIIVTAALVTLRWLIRARERVIVQEFVDYTSDDEKAVSGLAMLLVTELSRLRELYGHVNEQLSTPLSVGVRSGGGPGEAGSFLSVRADEVTEVLSGAVASESKVSFAGFTIPIGFVLSLLGRLARGPRVIGSVHFTEAGGGPTVTAQIVGRAKNFTWRIDAPPSREGRPDKAFLDPMVGEIACRMFTDMTLRGSVRWQAIRAFTAYLELYWESLRTPKNRASFLKKAEGRLLEAVAEDETFDLAFYNLGVVYSQLAQAEYLAAEAAEYPRRKGIDPEAAHRARTQAAQAAFTRAIGLNRSRWEAIYALAVHEFAELQHPHRASRDEGDRLHSLTSIVRRCDRVLELKRWNAQAYDLRGMAQIELGKPAQALKSHRRAVTRSWSRLCRAEYAERKTPPTGDSVLPGAQANAAAALHNLGQAHWKRARSSGLRRRLRVMRADRVMHQALSLAPMGARAAMEFERGRMREKHHPKRAAESYEAAIRIEPENALYWAHLAAAQAHVPERCADAERSAKSALDMLAPIFRRTLEPLCLTASVAMRDKAIAALCNAYGTLGRDFELERSRIADLPQLARRIAEAERPEERPPDTKELERLLGQYGDDRAWEREQVGLALARALGAVGDWEGAADRYDKLIDALKTERPAGIRQHALHAKRAKALRRIGRKQEALESAARGLVLDPISAVARRELGKAHFALLQYEEAREAWQHTLWLTPNDATLHWKVAFSFWSAAQDRQDSRARCDALAAAADGFEQASMLFGVESIEGWAWSQLWLGRTSMALGDDDLAVKHLRAAKGCTLTRLPARVLLGEVYQEQGDVGLSRYQFGKARTLLREEVVTAWRDAAIKDVFQLKRDKDWGETLTLGEIAARIQLGLARCAVELEDDPVKAAHYAVRAERQARRLEGQPRAHCRLRAQALDLQAQLDLADGKVTDALQRVQQAARLYPVPEVLLHELQVADTSVATSELGPERAQLIWQMAEGIRTIRRLDGDRGAYTRAGELIVRRWTGEDLASENGASPAPGGNGRAPSAA